VLVAVKRDRFAVRLGADTLKAKLLDQAILQGLVGTLDAALRLRCVGAKNVDVLAPTFFVAATCKCQCCPT
jgi:hypothetical protein